ncbi:MAG: hypothetical protein ACK5XN_15910 [Bacteroidota bacterium]
MSEADYRRRSALFSALKDDGAGFAVGEVTDSLIDAVLREGDTVEAVYMRGHGDEHISMAIGMTSRGDRYMVMDVFGPFAVRLEE